LPRGHHPRDHRPQTRKRALHHLHLLPHHASLAKRVAIRDARLTLYDRWTAEDKAAQAAAAQKAKVEAFSAACLAKMREENEAALAAWRATPEQQQRQRELEQLRLPEEPEEDEEEHDPVLERLIAESRAIREAPLSAFAADAGLGEDGEEIETPPAPPARHYQRDALEQFEDAAAWDRF
jgi:hypothetical protein